VRLGESVFKTSRIAPATLEAALEAFREFRDLMKEHGVVLHRAVATSATREAKNRSTFLDRVHEETGIDLEMIPGTEEARLVALGVRAKVKLSGTAMILDVGGGSSELALLQRNEILLVESHNLGTVRLLEQVGEGSKAKGGSLRIFRETVRASRFPLLESLRGHRVTKLVGTGGNIEALASLNSPDADKDDSVRKPVSVAVSSGDISAMTRSMASIAEVYGEIPRR
jgi:exopolyphosphatase/guanosine-5'-triphosphate,3'-diphosphate pyrophosphatase